MVVLRAREGQELLLEAELRALIGPSRKEEGCLTFDLHASVEQPGSYLLHEVWASREAHTEHLHTLHYLRWDARKDALVTFRDGTFWEFGCISALGETDAGTNYPTRIQDPNGNSLS